MKDLQIPPVTDIAARIPSELKFVKFVCLNSRAYLVHEITVDSVRYELQCTIQAYPSLYRVQTDFYKMRPLPAGYDVPDLLCTTYSQISQDAEPDAVLHLAKSVALQCSRAEAKIRGATQTKEDVDQDPDLLELWLSDAL